MKKSNNTTDGFQFDTGKTPAATTTTRKIISSVKMAINRTKHNRYDMATENANAIYSGNKMQRKKTESNRHIETHKFYRITSHHTNSIARYAKQCTTIYYGRLAIRKFATHLIGSLRRSISVWCFARVGRSIECVAVSIVSRRLLRRQRLLINQIQF